MLDMEYYKHAPGLQAFGCLVILVPSQTWISRPFLPTLWPLLTGNHMAEKDTALAGTSLFHSFQESSERQATRQICLLPLLIGRCACCCPCSPAFGNDASAFRFCWLVIQSYQQYCKRTGMLLVINHVRKDNRKTLTKAVLRDHYLKDSDT